MNYPLFFLIGVIPSIIWLLYFLRKDVHPEPNPVVLKVFILGMLVTIPAIFGELRIFSFLKTLSLPPDVFMVLYLFFGVALVEEFLKYLVVRLSVMNRPVLDEAIDLPLYMIIAALGFAALENTLILAGFSMQASFLAVASLSAVRFGGAVFLHALVSGLFGYFLALSLFGAKKLRFPYVLSGLGLAVFLHGLFNWYIIKEQGVMRFAVPVIIIFSLAIFISFALQKLKQYKSMRV